MIKLLPYILFYKYIYIFILALEMASPGNQHCASCIGTLSFPIGLIYHDATRKTTRRIGSICTYCLVGLSFDVQFSTCTQTDIQTETDAHHYTRLAYTRRGVAQKWTWVLGSSITGRVECFGDCRVGSGSVTLCWAESNDCVR